MIGSLPETLTVSGKEYPIRSDYRNVLDLFEALSDPELDDYCRNIVCVYMMFSDFTCADDVYSADGFDIAEAVKQVMWFISAGISNDEEERAPSYDWKKDEQLIFSSVNKVAGREVRDVDYMHWWTFLGYFNEVEEGTFSFVVGIRKKQNDGKKLEKHEKEFLKNNRSLVVMEKRMTEEERKEEEDFKNLIDSVIG